jgi:uncharacterized protein (DUF58 family)
VGRLSEFVWRSEFFPRKLSFFREGWIVFVVSIGLGIAAVNTGNNLLYLVFGLSLALIIISGIISESNLRGLKCSALPQVRPVAGRTSTVALTVSSQRSRFPAFAIEAWPSVDGAEVGPALFLDVRPGDSVTGACKMTFPRRGEYPVRGMVLSTAFPFSFFRKSLILPASGFVVVHPRTHDLVASELPPTSEGDEEHRPLSGRGQELFGVREFREGDNPRHLLHKRSAGRPEPVVREFEQAASRAVWIALVNVLPSGPDGADRVERAVEKAASLAVNLVDGGRTVGVVSVGGIVSLGSGSAQVNRILDFLATVPLLDMNPPGIEEPIRATLGDDPRAFVFWVRP